MANAANPTINIIHAADDAASIESEAISDRFLKLDGKAQQTISLTGDGRRKSKAQSVGRNSDTVSVGAVSEASVRQYKDHLDWSRHPSYTKFKLPYEVVCRQRYNRTAKKYDQQFRRELEKLESMQPSAYEALRFSRIFSITTLWPPLHTKKEIDYVLRNFFKIPPKQQARLDYLLKEEQT